LPMPNMDGVSLLQLKKFIRNNKKASDRSPACGREIKEAILLFRKLQHKCCNFLYNKKSGCCVKHFCVYFIQNCRGGCLHPPELRGDVGIAPYKKMNFYTQDSFHATVPFV